MISSEMKENRYIGPIVNSLDSFFFGSDASTSHAPFIHDAVDLKRYMFFVIMAALPCALAGIYLYGLRVVAVIAVSYIFGVGTEAIFAAVRRQDEIHEGAFVTCMLYALIMPPHVPLWVVAVGIVFGTVFAKEVFGGTGKNIFNPAMAGRLFISLAFPDLIARTWVLPLDTAGMGGFSVWISDAVTGATPLTLFQRSGEISNIAAIFWGNIGGCIGETVKPFIVLGGLFLMYTRISNWRLPIAAIFGLLLSSVVLHTIYPQQCAPVLFHLFGGGFLFAAFFMVSDPVTTPATRIGKWICGVMVGMLTVLIRTFTGYVEGVMFAVIIANIFTPLIDYIILSMRYRTARRGVR